MTIRPSNDSKYVLQGFTADHHRESTTRNNNEIVRILQLNKHSCLTCSHFHVPAKASSTCTQDHSKGSKRKFTNHYNICAKHSSAAALKNVTGGNTK
jgi:hypothetical protein